MIFDAMVTAGGIPEPGSSLYEFSQGKSKALIDIAGKPMVQWVLDALSEAKTVGNVVVVGLDKSSGVTCKKPLTFIPNEGGMLPNIRAAAKKIAEINPKAKDCLIVSSDTPTIKPDMVDWVSNQFRPGEEDLLYNVIERGVMEKRFPNSMRTFTKLKGMQVCGGDLTPVSMEVILSHKGPWGKLSDARKSPLKQAALVGLDTLVLLLLRQLTIENAAKRASKNLGLRARGQLCPFAEIGMDVDKAHHLEIVRHDFAARQHN